MNLALRLAIERNVPPRYTKTATETDQNEDRDAITETGDSQERKGKANYVEPTLPMVALPIIVSIPFHIFRLSNEDSKQCTPF